MFTAATICVCSLRAVVVTVLVRSAYRGYLDSDIYSAVNQAMKGGGSRNV